VVLLVELTFVNNQVVSDGRAPTLSGVDTESDNSNDSDFAKSGADITVIIDGNESLNATTSTITILGRTATPVQVDANTINGTVTVQSGDDDGGVTLIATVADTAGNTLAITEANIDGTTVTVDLTAPSLTTMTINGTNVVNAVDWYESNDDNLIIAINATELLFDPDQRYTDNPDSITINAVNLTATSTGYTINTNGATDSSFDIDFDVGETIAVPEGELQFSVTIEDKAGNTATFDQDDTTDFSSVTIDDTAPVVVSAIVSGDNTITINYDDVMLSTTIQAADFTLIDVSLSGTDDARGTGNATNSNSTAVVLTFDGAGVAPGTRSCTRY